VIILLAGLGLLTGPRGASAAELVLSWSGDCQTHTLYIMRNSMAKPKLR
jgi:hypothetical protein